MDMNIHLLQSHVTAQLQPDLLPYVARHALEPVPWPQKIFILGLRNSRLPYSVRLWYGIWANEYSICVCVICGYSSIKCKHLIKFFSHICNGAKTLSHVTNSCYMFCCVYYKIVLFLKVIKKQHGDCKCLCVYCSLSLWRVARGSKLMFLELIHGLFIT
jgi:hypothetical protein